MIGDILKRLRKIYGYTGVELSEKLNISPSFLSEIENNKKKPSLELLQKISDVYGIRLSSLILLSENYNDAEKQNKGSQFMQSIMSNFINKLSNNIEDPDEKKQKIWSYPK